MHLLKQLNSIYMKLIFTPPKKKKGAPKIENPLEEKGEAEVWQKETEVSGRLQYGFRQQRTLSLIGHKAFPSLVKAHFRGLEG